MTDTIAMHRVEMSTRGASLSHCVDIAQRLLDFPFSHENKAAAIDALSTLDSDGYARVLASLTRSSSTDQLRNMHDTLALHMGLPVSWRAAPDWNPHAALYGLRNAGRREHIAEEAGRIGAARLDVVRDYAAHELGRASFPGWLDAILCDPDSEDFLFSQDDSARLYQFWRTPDNMGVQVRYLHSLYAMESLTFESLAEAIRHYFHQVETWIVERLDACGESSAISECEDCGRYDWTEDSADVYGAMICSRCVSQCEECGCDCRASDMVNARMNGDYSVSICQSCAESGEYCERCDELMIGSHGSRCDSCRTRGVIGQYHSGRHGRALRHDDWSKANNGRLFGVELEVERADRAHDDCEDIAAEIGGIVNASGRILDFEYDGSLSDGFEMISHPMSLPAHRDLWARVLSLGVIRQLRSHDTTTCGLHVHMSRKGLAKLTIAKMSAFLSAPASRALVRCIARRSENSYARAHSRKLAHSANGFDRYEMLNLTNSATVELRIARGSLRPQTIIATVEFLHALAQWSAVTAMCDLSVESFIGFVYRQSNASDTKFLRPYMERRAMHSNYADIARAIASAKASSKSHHTGARIPRTLATSNSEER